MFLGQILSFSQTFFNLKATFQWLTLSSLLPSVGVLPVNNGRKGGWNVPSPRCSLSTGLWMTPTFLGQLSPDKHQLAGDYQRPGSRPVL